MTLVNPLSPKRLAEITRIPDQSISRTGRNEAINSSVKFSPRGTGADGSNITAAASSAGHSPAAAAAAAATRAKAEEERFFDAGIAFENDADASPSAVPSGPAQAPRGGDAATRDLRSSPPSHPLRDSLQRRVYESQRMVVFESMVRDAAQFTLVDEGGISHEAVAALHSGRGLHRPRDLDDIDSLDGDAPQDDAGSADATTKPAPVLTPTKPPAPQPAAQLPSPPRDGKSAANGASPLKSRSGAPQPLSAAFLSPDRWRTVSPRSGGATAVPPVGHYRPKYHATQYAVTGGYITSPDHTTPRGTKPKVFTVLPAVQTARDRAEREAELAEQRRRGDAEPQSPTSDLDDMDSGKPRKLPPPAPTRDSSWAFKSTIPQCPMPLFSAAPDKWYWPRNDDAPGGSHPPLGQVRFDKQTDRKPLATSQDVPDAYYNVTNGLFSDRSPVHMSKQTPRPPQKIAHINDVPFYDTSRADGVTRVVPKAVDFAKLSPRSEGAGLSGTRGGSGTSAELDGNTQYYSHSPAAEGIPGNSPLTQKRVPVLNLDRLTGRKDALLTHINDLTYDASAQLTSPRERSAIIRADNTGHQPLFQPSITDKCDYSPRIDVVRPRSIREVNFDKDVPRRPQMAQMHDLVYDAKDEVTTKRVVGDPMIAVRLDRDKREKVLSPKRVQLEAPNASEFNLDKIRPVKTGAAVDFSKQVTKETQFAGRGMPSDRWARNNPPAPPPGSYDVRYV